MQGRGEVGSASSAGVGDGGRVSRDWSRGDRRHQLAMLMSAHPRFRANRSSPRVGRNRRKHRGYASRPEPFRGAVRIDGDGNGKNDFTRDNPDSEDGSRRTRKRAANAGQVGITYHNSVNLADDGTYAKDNARDSQEVGGTSTGADGDLSPGSSWSIPEPGEADSMYPHGGFLGYKTAVNKVMRGFRDDGICATAPLNGSGMCPPQQQVDGAVGSSGDATSGMEQGEAFFDGDDDHVNDVGEFMTDRVSVEEVRSGSSGHKEQRETTPATAMATGEQSRSSPHVPLRVRGSRSDSRYAYVLRYTGKNRLKWLMLLKNCKKSDAVGVKAILQNGQAEGKPYFRVFIFGETPVIGSNVLLTVG